MSDVPSPPQLRDRSASGSFLAPVARPGALLLKLLYWLMRRQFGFVPKPFSVFCARMPVAFAMFYGKVSRLDRKLQLPEDVAVLIRARVNGMNVCHWCMDMTKWYVVNKSPHNAVKLEALPDYRSSPLFSNKERAALDFATELTKHKYVSAATFATLPPHYSQREICEIVWLVASEHLYNISNIGLGLGSDGMCESKR